MSLVLEMQNVSKTFYGDGTVVKANDDINFSLYEGEIHALLGENGAGKSTLVNTLFHKPDSGIVRLHGEEVELKNPMTAIKYGLGIARQDLTKVLVERHSIAENILSISQGFFLSLKTIAKEIERVLNDYDLGKLNPYMKVGRLSGGEKQRVEILKALITNPEIVILDEPTAMLTPLEIDNLFKLLSVLKKQGKSIVLITHHLEEAVRFSDRITILRHGKVVSTIETKIAKEKWSSEDDGIRNLANLMVGKELLYDFKIDSIERGNIAMEVEKISVMNDMGDEVVSDVNIDLKENTILGLAGIAGNGQTELVEAILGWRKKEGRVTIRGADVTNLSIKELRSLGIAYVPENRRKALISDLSIIENLMLNTYKDRKGIFTDVNATVTQVDQLIEKFNIKAPNALVPVQTLSGGNKQKVVVAREFSIIPPADSKLILLAENPTFGLDVGTTQFVREELLKLRSSGAAILLISNDLTEILTLCDEIAVIQKGEIKGLLTRNEATREKLGLLMGGSLLDLEGNN